MKHSIQEPILVNVQDLVKEFGSHYVFQHPKNIGSNDYKNFKIIQKISPKDTLNEWDHQHTSIEEAMDAGRKTIYRVNEKKVNDFDAGIKKLPIKWFQLKMKLGLANKELAKEFNEFKNDIENCRAVINNKNIQIPVQLLEGEYKIPKYRIVLGQEVFIVNFTRTPKIEVTKGVVTESMVYDYRGSTSNNKEADRYDFKFTVYISDLDKDKDKDNDNDNAIASVDGDRMIIFNGKYFETGMCNVYVFLDEQVANEFVQEQYASYKKKLEEYSQDFEKVINKDS